MSHLQLDLGEIQSGEYNTLAQLLATQAFVDGLIVSQKDIVVLQSLPLSFLEHKARLPQSIIRWHNFVAMLQPAHILHLPLEGQTFMSTSSLSETSSSSSSSSSSSCDSHHLLEFPSDPIQNYHCSLQDETNHNNNNTNNNNTRHPHRHHSNSQSPHRSGSNSPSQRSAYTTTGIEFIKVNVGNSGQVIDTPDNFIPHDPINQLHSQHHCVELYDRPSAATHKQYRDEDPFVMSAAVRNHHHHHNTTPTELERYNVTDESSGRPFHKQQQQQQQQQPFLPQPRHHHHHQQQQQHQQYQQHQQHQQHNQYQQPESGKHTPIRFKYDHATVERSANTTTSLKAGNSNPSPNRSGGGGSGGRQKSRDGSRQQQNSEKDYQAHLDSCTECRCCRLHNPVSLWNNTSQSLVGEANHLHLNNNINTHDPHHRHHANNNLPQDTTALLNYRRKQNHDFPSHNTNPSSHNNNNNPTRIANSPMAGSGLVRSQRGSPTDTPQGSVYTGSRGRDGSQPHDTNPNLSSFDRDSSDGPTVHCTCCHYLRSHFDHENDDDDDDTSERCSCCGRGGRGGDGSFTSSLSSFSDSASSPSSSDFTSQSDNDEYKLIKVIEQRKNPRMAREQSTVLFDFQTNSPDVNAEDLVAEIRSVERESLTWAQAHEILPVAFGIIKIRISAVITNVCVDVDDLMVELGNLGGVVDVKIIAFKKVQQ